MFDMREKIAAKSRLIQWICIALHWSLCGLATGHRCLNHNCLGSDWIVLISKGIQISQEVDIEQLFIISFFSECLVSTRAKMLQNHAILEQSTLLSIQSSEFVHRFRSTCLCLHWWSSFKSDLSPFGFRIPDLMPWLNKGSFCSL